MFKSCKSLVSLDLSSFNTENVKSMTYMFDECYSLTSLNFANFKVPNLKYMNYMFCRCFSLISLDLFMFDIKNIDKSGEQNENQIIRKIFHNYCSLTNKFIQSLINQK